MAEGVIELVLEDKGENATAGGVTPEEFFNFSFETSWSGYLTVAVAASAGTIVGVYLGSVGVAAYVGTSFWAWGAAALSTGTQATIITVAGGTAGAVAGSIGAGAVALINSASEALEQLVEFKSEDYSYFINRYRTFDPDQRQSIATCLLIKIKKKLIEKETTTNDEKRFYKAFRDMIQYEDKSSGFYGFAKTLVTIIDWLFVLNGITNVQTGNTVLLERYSKANMISKISVKVDQMLKDGFNLGDITGIKFNLGFADLTGPYVEVEDKFSLAYQYFQYPELNGTSKIISDDLEEAAENIANNIQAIQDSNVPGMKKYASLIGKDLTNNILQSENFFGNIKNNKIGKYKYNGKIVDPDDNGWGDEDSYPGKTHDIKKAKQTINSGFIQNPERGGGGGGLENTNVISFGEKFDPKSLETDKLSGVSVIPQPGADVGKVVESLIDAGYAFFVAELGQEAFGNKNLNQKTLFEQSVDYYSEIIARVIGTVLNNVQKFYLYLEYSALFVDGVDPETERDLFDTANERAQQALANAAANIATGGGLDSSLKITDEQLKTRQKFVKQCLLMYNLESLRTEYRTYIRQQPTSNRSHRIHGNRPFGGRFHAIEDSESQNTNTINKMIVPKGKEMKPLLEITPDIHAFLVPKIRLFRVVHRLDGDQLLETEFDFKKKENKVRINNLVSTDFDKGGSYGIKSFDFTFEGTSPATARNDIVANLSLHFQSFSDFIKPRVASNGETYKFVHLLIFPVNKKNRKGIGTLRAEEYDPSIYRIRAEVGWAIPERHEGLDAALIKRGFTYEQLKKSLILTNKSFYLNMVDHDFSIKDDGTVDINISYRAYIESALKSTKFDALSTPSLRKNREKFKEAMFVALEKDNCSVEEIKVIKELFQRAEEETIKNVYRSLLLRLNESNSIFYVDAHVNDIKQFRRDGFFSRGLAPRLITATGKSVTDQKSTVKDMKQKAEGSTEEEGSETLRLLQDGVRDYPDEDMKEDNRINFFYLGDLIYTMMDNMYDEDGKQNIDMNKTKLLLSSFATFGAFGKADGTQSKSFNIIDIPVSVEYFYEWFTQNVIKPKKLYYPMMDFVRDITNDLVVNLLFDSCADRPIDTKMRFNTANFVLLSKDNKDPFLDFKSNETIGNFPVIDLADYYGTELPLLSDKEGEKNILDFYNYIAIYPIVTTVVHPGSGDKTKDQDRGIYHFHIGSDRGLLKKINFSKTDTQYLRESRFMRNGFDGMMQLSAVYKVSMNLIGNTIYYPGMDLFIDPIGIGGPGFKSTDETSLAYITGIGGYHLVTRVKSTISPGKFETTIDALWHNSGAGTGRFTDRPDMAGNKNLIDNGDPSDISQKPRNAEFAQGTVVDTSTKCTPLISSFEDFLANVQSSSGPVDFTPDLSSFNQNEDSSSTSIDVAEQETLIDEDGNPVDEFSQFPESNPDEDGAS
jgi:hypothetical protein